jgi:hypothetical protein
MKCTILCKSIQYYSSFDEDLFFEWVKKIKSITKFDGKHDELYLHFESKTIDDDDLRELLALFHRYKIKHINQLKLFLNETNRCWFYENKHAYWHKKIFNA